MRYLVWFVAALALACGMVGCTNETTETVHYGYQGAKPARCAACD